MKYIVARPIAADFEASKDLIKSLGGFYVPEKKCWVLADTDCDGFERCGEFETVASIEQVKNSTRLHAIIDQCADFDSWWEGKDD